MASRFVASTGFSILGFGAIEERPQELLARRASRAAREALLCHAADPLDWSRALREAAPRRGSRYLNGYGPSGPALPATPEEWTQLRWLRCVSHGDAPWLTPRIRRRVNDFARVIACRFPTAQDTRISGAGKTILRTLSGWRYATRRYDHPW